MTWIKNHWMWIVIGIAILIIAYGAWNRTDRTLVKLLMKAYNQEESQAIQNRDEELAKLDKEKTGVLNQLAKVQKEKADLQNRYIDINKKYLDLVDAVRRIVVPQDLDDLIKDLQQRGYPSARKGVMPK